MPLEESLQFQVRCNTEKRSMTDNISGRINTNSDTYCKGVGGEGMAKLAFLRTDGARSCICIKSTKYSPEYFEVFN